MKEIRKLDERLHEKLKRFYKGGDDKFDKAFENYEIYIWQKKCYDESEL